MRFSALDLHRDFCEVVIAEGGQVRRAGRVETTPATLELFAQGPCRGSSGCARGERKRVGDRPDHRAGCQSGCACQPEGEQEGDADGEDGQARGAHAREAARGRLSARGLDAPTSRRVSCVEGSAARRSSVRQRTREQNQLQAILIGEPEGSLAPRLTCLASQVGAGLPSSSCRRTSGRCSKRACAGSTSSTPRSRRSIGRSPSSYWHQPSCAGY